MNEINSSEERSPPPATNKEPSVFQRQGGQALFAGFSCLAIAPFTSPSLRKRRVSLGAIDAEAGLLPIVQEQIEPFQNTEQTYSYPPRTSFHEEHIKTIFTAMGTERYFTLWAMEAELEARGKAIASLHPFRLLGFLFSDPQLKNHMKVVMGDLWMQPRFLKDLKEGMEREQRKNNVTPHIDAFAKEVGVLAENIRPWIEDRAWEQLVHHLIAESGGPKEQRFPE